MQNFRENKYNVAPQTAPQTTAAFEWNVDDDGVTITRVLGEPSNCVIPASLDGKPVVRIGERAFAECKSLTSVTLPDGLQTVGEEAFKYILN